MTISTNKVQEKYLADGTTTQWNIPFVFNNKEDIEIYVIDSNGTVTKVTEDYAINEASNVLTYPVQNNGAEPLAVGKTLLIRRCTPLLQEINLDAQSDVPKSVLESGYDKAMMIAQELSEQIGRAVCFPVGTTNGQTSAKQYLDTINSAVTTAQGAASTAQAAAASAASDTQAAINSYTDSAVNTETVARQAADNTLQTNIDTEAAARATADALKLDITTAASTYLAKTDAASTYLSKTDAASTYLTQVNAASTYATQSALTTGLSGKQATLTTAQTAAVNSGITSNIVGQVQTNLQTITAMIPYLQNAAVRDMNEQTIVDAQDLLAATGELHALNLDLSKNAALTKLTASGTSENTAKLASVLVSSAAAFSSATSPQLDVRYTTLNKSALVNLFNSMPYNCGYTVTGSPTITDGVASGFSASNLLQTSLQVAPQNITEWVAKIKINAAAIGSERYHYVFYGPASSSFNFYGGSSGAQAINLVACYLPGAGETLSWSSANLVADSWYWFKYTYDGTTAKLYFSTDGINYGAEKASKTATISGNAGLRTIGTRWSGDSSYFDGELDLNETYIKVNAIPWFTGTVATTKTCDVRGCTGTADLTAEDKAIATDKGWSLTVA